MRRNWWIISLIIGLAASAFFGWRVATKHFEIPQQQIQNDLDRIREAKDLAKGQDSVAYRQLARKLAAMLGKDPDSSSVDPRNLPAFTYWQGWAEYKAASLNISRLLKSAGALADPRHETYLNAFEELEAAAASDNLDVPVLSDAEAQSRFNTLVRDELQDVLGDQQDKLLAAAGIAISSETGMVERFDAMALKRVGISVGHVADEAQRPAHVLPQASPVSAAQRRFLAHRLAVYRQLEDIQLQIAHRFMELGAPEYTWQFLDVLVHDKPVAKGKYIMRNLFGRFVDAKERHMSALAAFMEKPEDNNARALLEQGRERVKATRELLEVELLNAMKSARDGQPRLVDLRRTYVAREQDLLKHEARLKDFDPEEEQYRWETRRGVSESASDFVGFEKAGIDEELTQNLPRERYRVMAALRAIDQIGTLDRDVLSAGEWRDDLVPKEQRERSFSPEFLEKTIASTKLNARLPVAEGTYVGDRDEYLMALRDVYLADLLRLRATAVRLIGDEKSATELLGDGEIELGRINRSFSLVRQGLAGAYNFDDRDGFDDVGDAGMAGGNDFLPGMIKRNFEFLEQLIEFSLKNTKQNLRSDPVEIMRFETLQREFRDLQESLLRTSFEHAELHYQRMLDLMRQLTGNNAPFVSFRAAKAMEARQLRYVEELASYIRQGGQKPTDPMEDERFDRDPEWRQVKQFMALEREYRRQRDLVLNMYREFENAANYDIQRRSRFGIASVIIDDLQYAYDFKWRNGMYEDPANPDAGLAAGYGPFAFVDDVPRELRLKTPNFEVDRHMGRWLAPGREISDWLIAGPPPRPVAEAERVLASLRNVALSDDPHLYVAVRFRSGQLLELAKPAFFANRTPQGRSVEDFYPGDLPGALREYYLPLLAPSMVIDPEVLNNNRYIPLRVHFARVSRKLNHWLRNANRFQTDADSAIKSLDALFEALAPPAPAAMGESDEAKKARNQRRDEALITDFYGEYFSSVAARNPGLLDQVDARHDFNFQLGLLGQVRASRKIETLGPGMEAELEQAKELGDRALAYFREAGDILFNYINQFPDAPGETDRLLLIGDSYFRSKDYVFAVSAYRDYFVRRRQVDQKEQRAQLFFVGNRIGECYLALGIMEGESLREALASGVQAAIDAESRSDTMTLDGAKQAFSWVIQEVKKSLRDRGEGGLPRNSLPPVGSLDAFINMARARLEQGRMLSGVDDERAREEFLGAATMLEADLFEGRMFPAPLPSFNQSLYWRDGKFYQGVAYLELAKRERAKPDAEVDRKLLKTYFDRAFDALVNIVQNFAEPMNREKFREAVAQGLDFATAHTASAGSQQGSVDALFYLTIFNLAEIEWLRALHVADEDLASDTVVTNLSMAQSRLAGLVEQLSRLKKFNSNIGDSGITIPALTEQSRYMLGDVLYLRARTLRDQLERGKQVDVFDIERTFDHAKKAYDEARSFHKDTYLAAWAYAQQLNIWRALEEYRPLQARAEADRMLESTESFLAGLSDAAFDGAPANMGREDWVNYFAWYRQSVAQVRNGG